MYGHLQVSPHGLMHSFAYFECRQTTCRASQKFEDKWSMFSGSYGELHRNTHQDSMEGFKLKQGMFHVFMFSQRVWEQAKLSILKNINVFQGLSGDIELIRVQS